jgi:signal peptidase II
METQINPSAAPRLKPGALVVGAVALIVFVLDQLFKYLVVREIGMNSAWYPLPGFDWLRLIPSTNTGTACGYLPQFSIVFTLAPFFILAIVIYFYRSQKQPSWLLSIGVGLIIGGAFGNLADRLRLGYVVDFVQVGGWPIFNVADAAVSTAVVLMLLWSLREDSARAPAVPGSPGAAAPAGRDSSFKLGLVFIGVLGVVAVLGYFVCVFVPANLLR